MMRWEGVATAIREAILRGDYRPGDTIPKERVLMDLHQVSRATVRRAVAQLTAEGLIQPVRRKGTVVRGRPPRTRIVRSRRVYRDEIGYFFDRTAQTWRALRPPQIGWGPCPYDIARLLGVGAGDEVLIRDRTMGDPDATEVRQLTTSYLPPDLARGTVLAEADTGPGGIYDRLEEMGHAPLTWAETISARMPTPGEATSLGLAPGTPLLGITRITTGRSGIVLEVNDTRLDAERYEIAYSLTRDRSARPDAPS